MNDGRETQFSHEPRPTEFSKAMSHHESQRRSGAAPHATGGAAASGFIFQALPGMEPGTAGDLKGKARQQQLPSIRCPRGQHGCVPCATRAHADARDSPAAAAVHETTHVHE